MTSATEGARLKIDSLRTMSIEQRLAVAESLREFAWEVNTATLRRQHPDWSDEEVLGAVRAAFR